MNGVATIAMLQNPECVIYCNQMEILQTFPFSILFAMEIFMSRGLTNYGPRRRALPINNSINILCSSGGENLRTHKKLCYDYVGESEISLAERLGVPSTPSLFETRLDLFIFKRDIFSIKKN